MEILEEDRKKLDEFCRHQYFIKYPRQYSSSCIKICFDRLLNDISGLDFETWMKENLDEHDFKVLFLFCEKDTQETAEMPEDVIQNKF
jgi:hypothetical protein